MYPALFCFDKERGKRTVSFFLFEQLLQRSGRGKAILSILCSFVSLRQRDASEVEWFLLKLHFAVGISVLQ